MNVPFISPSSISIVILHMVCILNCLVARPQQCLNWRCICLGSYIKCLLGCLCDRMELEPPWGPRTEVILYIVAKFEIAKNLHFQIWNIFPVPKILSNLQNPLQSSKSLNFVQHETWWQYIQIYIKFQTFSSFQMDNCCRCKFCHNRENVFWTDLRKREKKPFIHKIPSQGTIRLSSQTQYQEETMRSQGISIL